MRFVWAATVGFTAVRAAPAKCPGAGTAGPVLGGVDFVDLLDYYETEQTKKVPEYGVETFSHTLADETYGTDYVFHFKSQANADKFAQNPEKYMPGGGGF